MQKISPPLHLLALEIKLPLERFDELPARRERQRTYLRESPVQSAIGEKEGVAYKRTDGNKKAGSASSRVRSSVPHASQATSTVVSIPASTRAIS